MLNTTNFNWALWKSEPTSMSFQVLPESELPEAGFASVYRYQERDAAAFKASNSYKGFKGTVFSEKLKIDTDDSKSAEIVQDKLRNLKVSFSRFTTGNRGKHFLVKRDAPESHLLPAYDKWLVEQLFPVVDKSIYHHVALYRQKGCVHTKTGEPKRLELWRPGAALQNRFEEFLGQQRTVPVTQTTSPRLRSIFDDAYLSRLVHPLSVGSRRTMLIKIARQLCRLGQTQAFSLEFLKNVLAWDGEPLPDAELQRMVLWAFSQE